MNNKVFRSLVILVLALGLTALVLVVYYKLTPTAKQTDEAKMEEKKDAVGDTTLEVPAPGAEGVDEMIEGGEGGEVATEDGEGATGEEKPEEPLVTPPEEAPEAPAEEVPVKHISLQSYTDVQGFKFYPKFSLKEITVNKGDKVRISVNVTSGSHNFNIDEFGVAVATPTGKVTTVEFTANKAGEFVYYCGMPGHRAAGQWGTLKVVNPLIAEPLGTPKAAQ